MGRSTAAALIAAGAYVTVTLGRHHKSADDARCIPAGCRTVPYDRRAEALDAVSVVISATTSPHYTVTRELIASLAPCSRIFVDLAVPRDVEPSVADLPECTLLTIDDIPSDTTVVARHAAEEKASTVIDRYISEFYAQLSSWDCLPEVNLLADRLAVAVADFIRRELARSEFSGGDTVATAAGMYARKKGQALLFTFRDWIGKNATTSGGR